MRTRVFALTVLAALALLNCRPAGSGAEADFSAVTRIESGHPVAVMLTSYSTTLRADGKNWTPLRIAITDSSSREITSATDSIRVYLNGDGALTSLQGAVLPMVDDTGGTRYAEVRLVKGVSRIGFKAGRLPGKVRIEARSGSLFPGAHEIHTIPGDTRMLHPTAAQLPPTTKPIGRMIGADISWLPQIENRDGRFAQGNSAFFENGARIDAIALLKAHGFNFIRLRIFVHPENPKGYSPGVGFCGLDSTLSMARRIKAAGLGLLLDFHYSDYWADPQQQNKPLAWEGLAYPALRDSVKSYTTSVLRAMAQQHTLPDMVQIGNEINHGLLWPDGHIGNPDQLAGLLQAGVEGTEAVDPKIPVMMHIALGGQNDEARFWLDNMLARGVKFDIIGLSYYPRWHGTLEDLSRNLNDLVQRYHKPVNVVEYSDFKRPIHDIVFGLPGGMGRGAAIWEPLGWWSGLFDRAGNVTGLMTTYDSLRSRYLEAAAQP
jgi:glycosyl hydrolase family 53